MFSLLTEHDAMGSDEYHSLSHRGSNISSRTSSGGIGYTVLDAIDTMYIMGLNAEYARARFWLKTELQDFDQDGVFSTFEVSGISSTLLCRTPTCLNRLPYVSWGACYLWFIYPNPLLTGTSTCLVQLTLATDY
jgi:hypothetical protein